MHEPIISSQDFEAVQNKVQAWQRLTNNGDFSLFAGLIRCGECVKIIAVYKTHTKMPAVLITPMVKAVVPNIRLSMRL